MHVNVTQPCGNHPSVTLTISASNVIGSNVPNGVLWPVSLSLEVSQQQKCVNLNDLGCHQCTTWHAQMLRNIITGLVRDWNPVMSIKVPSKCKKAAIYLAFSGIQHRLSKWFTCQVVFIANNIWFMAKNLLHWAFSGDVFIQSLTHYCFIKSYISASTAEQITFILFVTLNVWFARLRQYRMQKVGAKLTASSKAKTDHIKFFFGAIWNVICLLKRGKNLKCTLISDDFCP